MKYNHVYVYDYDLSKIGQPNYLRKDQCSSIIHGFIVDLFIKVKYLFKKAMYLSIKSQTID